VAVTERGGGRSGVDGGAARDAAAAAVARAVLGPHGRTDLLRRLAAYQHGASPGAAAADLGAAASIVDKVARHAHALRDEDIDEARRAGLSDDELFDLIVAAAAGAGLARRATGRAAVARWEEGR